jgi:5-methyltetrahydrofolate--homocysteine methyltransferase
MLKNKIAILDGSTGVMLQRRGMPTGVCPEAFCLEHPEIIRGIQTEYFQAGSDVVYTPTFGANRVKLHNYNLEHKVADFNQRLAELSLNVAHQHHGLAAGNVSATGLFFAPFGETTFDQGLEIFSEQIQALAAAGVNLIVIETMIDIQESRIALLAAKSVCKLPVIVSVTFDEHGRTLTGSDPLTCLNVLQSLGADGFGVNCSTGPEPMVNIVKDLAPYARVPLLAKPNAGLPQVVDGKTVFPMAAEEFGSFAQAFWEAGATLVGGCCGTTPEHIRALASGIKGKPVQPVMAAPAALLLSSPRRTIGLSREAHQPLRVIGERINPTGKPQLQAALLAGKLDALRDLALAQQAQGADILDVNLGMPGVDEKALMVQAVEALALASELPLCVDSSRPEVVEAAARIYPGRLLINSLSGETHKLEKLVPVAAQYGSAFIFLPLDDDGIPETLAERQEILEAFLRQCEESGVSREAMVVDGLALTVSANPAHAALALDTLRYAAETLKVNTVLGLSNISFGLPARPYLNSAFLAMAAAAGLSSVIANPGDELLRDLRLSADVLTGRDPGAVKFLERFAKAPAPAAGQPAAPGAALSIRDLVIKGRKERIVEALQERLEKGEAPLALLTGQMFPAIQEVGDKYAQRIFFLPQLIAAAEAMERGVQHLTPLLANAGQAQKGTVVMATVKGDVHDIGKKIVGLMLRNNGYKVIDLGKSVDEEAIISAALANQASVIGLSALMTTTMVEMPKVIALARQRCPGVKVMVGGAVVTRKYAEEIQADAYAADSVQAVAAVDRCLGRVP